MADIRVALNAWSLISTHTGIASYTRNLALALQRLGTVDLRFFYGWGWSSAIRSHPAPGIEPLKTWIKRVVPRPYSLMRALQQQRFGAGIRGLNRDLYHEPSFLPFRFEGATVITVHDLSMLRYPETHPAARVREVMSRLPRAVQAAGAIITDSEFIRDEVISMLGAAPERVHSAPLGVAPEFRPRAAAQTAAALVAHNLEYRGYMLAVGTLEPRKNLIQAIEAHGALPEAMRRATPLVIAGMRGWLTVDLEAKIRYREERGEVRWLGYVPADALPMIYSAARMLVYPSFYEGFGLPVLEAMASGIPVITTHSASLPEVAGNVGLMVDPADVAGLCEQMRRLIEDEDEAARRGMLGIERARRFTWDACAEKTLAVYRRALEA